MKILSINFRFIVGLYHQLYSIKYFRKIKQYFNHIHLTFIEGTTCRGNHHKLDQGDKDSKIEHRTNSNKVNINHFKKQCDIDF